MWQKEKRERRERSRQGRQWDHGEIVLACWKIIGSRRVWRDTVEARSSRTGHRGAGLGPWAGSLWGLWGRQGSVSGSA